METFKKSLLKSTSSSSSSVDKPTEKTLNIRTTEVRSPSPIPEDPVEEEVSKQPKPMSAETTDQDKKIDEMKKSKTESMQEQPKKNGKTSEEEKVKEEEEKKEKSIDEDKNEQSKKRGDNDDKEEIPGSKEENKAGKHDEFDTKKDEPEITSTTKLQGKSKATGRITGGWI